MSFFSDWMPSWLEGLFALVSKIGAYIWFVLQNGWKVILISVSVIVGLIEYTAASFVAITEYSTAAWGVLTGATTAMENAMTIGWPPEMAAAVAYGNNYFPIGYTISMLGGLLLLWITCTIIRVIKSWLPAFGT